jgi:glycosyltransferase involved in cell wall biosynthesis/peptidoglycan/xylan/chitin deacetylase (PgdA/CDA1 family)
MQGPLYTSQITVVHYSVVIPTYQRRDVVLRSVRSLARQQFNGSFEVIVVVDGSNDGTAEAFRSIHFPFPITILEQPNRGAATARNKGAAAAQGEILLFLDDDMEAHPNLLAEHDRSHREGADIVLGHIPLHPESPPTILTPGVKSWAERRAERLSAPDATLPLHDLLTGQLSLPRRIFDNIKQFDTRFTRGGSFGNEDLDFGYRLLVAGYHIVFNPNAISWQYYTVQPRRYLQQWHQAGHADVAFVRKHPNQIETIFARRAKRWVNRYVWRPLLAVPLLRPSLIGLLRSIVLALIDHGARDRITTKLFFEIRTIEYWRGVREAGGMPRPRPLRVVAYHAIADLEHDPVIGRYGIPPDVFCRQLDMLLAAGYRFIDADELLRFLYDHGGLPHRALLLTFDDCYEELADVVLPILEDRGIPAVAFAVTGFLGRTNAWDQAKGASERRLVAEDGLQKLAKRGIEIGAHSRTHRPLARLPAEELREEIEGSMNDVECLGIARPRLFAYPHGEYNHKVKEALEKTSLQAAFTVDPGQVRAGDDPYCISRIEVMREDVGWKLRRKIILPNWPLRPDKALRLQLQKLRSVLQGSPKQSASSCT